MPNKLFGKLMGLLTDFGPDNHYVAQMKGRILGISRDIQIVDVTHSVVPQNILHGAYVLRDTIDAFPPESVFVVVVDPGVGTDRRILIVEANRQVFVLPDNGLISVVQQEFKIDKVVHVNSDAFATSSTFHGRDIMAPLGARVALGDSPEKFGKLLRTDDLEKFNLEPPQFHQVPGGRHQITGRVVYRDLFGNLITNIGVGQLPATLGQCHVRFGQRNLAGVHNTFADAEPGDMLALIGSHYRLEIAVNRGNAFQVAKQEIGDDPFEELVIVSW